MRAPDDRDSELDDLLDGIDIETFLDDQGWQYRRTHGSSGPQLNVNECPACGTKKWKVYLNAETGLGNCFSAGCDRGTFNKFSFIRAALGNVPTREVKDYLRTAAGLATFRSKRALRDVKMDVGAWTLPKSVSIPIQGKYNLKYLAERNVSVELAEYFHLRYSVNGTFPYEFDGRKIVQDYSKRIILPVFDMNGTLATFQGRDITGNAEPKYLFPPGLAATGRLLYNGHNALGAPRVLVNEGVFDVIASKRALESDPDLADIIPIGSFGIKLSDLDKAESRDQLGALLRLKESGTEEVIFMWDGEYQALKNANAAALLLRKNGIKSTLAMLPPGTDPNEASPEDVRAAIYRRTSPNHSSVLRQMVTLQAMGV